MNKRYKYRVDINFVDDSYWGLGSRYTNEHRYFNDFNKLKEFCSGLFNYSTFKSIGANGKDCIFQVEKFHIFELSEKELYINDIMGDGSRKEESQFIGPICAWCSEKHLGIDCPQRGQYSNKPKPVIGGIVGLDKSKEEAISFVHEVMNNIKALVASKDGEIKNLKWQVSNWERKEIRKASCCIANEDKASKLEQENKELKEKFNKLKQMIEGR